MQEFQSLRADEMAVVQASVVDFAQGSFDPVAAQINSHAQFLGEFRGIAGQEMAMAAAKF